MVDQELVQVHEPFESYNVATLKEACRARGLRIYGPKPFLTNRLRANVAALAGVLEQMAYAGAAGQVHHMEAPCIGVRVGSLARGPRDANPEGAQGAEGA